MLQWLFKDSKQKNVELKHENRHQNTIWRAEEDNNQFRELYDQLLGDVQGLVSCSNP